MTCMNHTSWGVRRVDEWGQVSWIGWYIDGVQDG
jgi:hypothetical protein